MDKIILKENFDKKIFTKYEELLQKWQKAINLVSPNTLNNVWERHLEDSLYLYDFIKDKENIFDIGSGAGFPAMVLAIAGKDEKDFPKITLVEADERKCFFLQEIKRAYNLTDDRVKIKNIRIENLENPADSMIPSGNNFINCITGRAFAPLETFFDLCKNIINNKTEMILLKGDNYQEEISKAEKNWCFKYSVYKKKNGVIIRINNIKQK